MLCNLGHLCQANHNANCFKFWTVWPNNYTKSFLYLQQFLNPFSDQFGVQSITRPYNWCLNTLVLHNDNCYYFYYIISIIWLQIFVSRICCNQRVASEPPTSCKTVAEIQSERNMHLIKRVHGRCHATVLAGSQGKRPLSKQEPYLNGQPETLAYSTTQTNNK